VSFALPEPEDAPDWAFAHDQDIHCPECGTQLTGLDWVMGEPGIEAMCMHLIPCGHELPTYVWELQYHGRTRLHHTVARNPMFVRKDAKRKRGSGRIIR